MPCEVIAYFSFLLFPLIQLVVVYFNIMNFIELCQQRYSVRSYHPLAIEQEKLDYVLQCARLAPSAVNFQPWKLQLITNKKEMDAVKQCYNRSWFETVGTCIIIYKNKEQEWVRKQDLKPHGDIDVAIITEHICLAAAEQGLGTCWVCNYKPEPLAELIPQTEEWEAVAIVPLGHIAEDCPVGEKKRKDLSEIVERV